MAATDLDKNTTVKLHMTSTKKLLPKAKSLVESLDELESKLEPLLSHPLGENLASLEKLQQAKLNVLLPYLINDLIFSKSVALYHRYILIR